MKINEDWDVENHNDVVMATSGLTRVELYHDPEKKCNYIRIQASKYGSTIGEVKTVTDQKPFAPFVLVQVIK
jgi:hypothetical protein